MPGVPSMFSRIRFAPAAVVLADAEAAAAPPILDIPRAEGLALLEWLGLGRPDFGAIPARELAPRCRRRLWSIERNAHPALRFRTTELLAVAETVGDGMVLFG
jgi:hypothetical protein